MSVFEYKGYLGSADVDIEGNALVGKLLFIRDTITYSAHDVAGLEAAFREAVDEYLATCEGLGERPDIPCKGSFNVRVGPERHREAALNARKKGIGLNEFVCQAIDLACSSRTEHHTHIDVKFFAEHRTTVGVARASGVPSWEHRSQHVH